MGKFRACSIRICRKPSDCTWLVVRILAILWILGSLNPIPAQGTLPLLTRVEQVKRLSNAQARRGYPVRLRGVVRFHDPDLSILSIQDYSGGTAVELKDPGFPLKPGQWIEIEGVSAPGSHLPFISKARFRLIPAQTLPPLRRISLAAFDRARDDGLWVQIEGIVHNSYQEDRYTVLEVHEGRHCVYVRVRDYPMESASRLIDARIRAQGVMTALWEAQEKSVRLNLWVPQTDAIKQLASSPSLLGQIPISSIGTLQKIWPARPPEHRIRIQGAVLQGEKENTLLIRDPSGTIAAQALFTRMVTPGDEVDLIGFADLGSPVPRIINAIFLRIKSRAIESAEEAGLPLLTKIHKIRRLSAQEAARGYPVKIRGIITYHNPQLSMTFIQDDSDAIYLQSFDPVLALQPHTLYEVSGFSAPGDYAPIIVKPVFKALGPAPLPPAKRVTFDELSTGRYDCVRVQTSGVVLSIRQVDNRWQLALFNDGKTIQVWLSNPAFGAPTLSLQDAAIRVEGVCSIQTSEWGSISGFKINVPSMADIQVEEPARFPPLAAPLHTIKEAFRYSSPKGMMHRIRIEGVVLHQRKDRTLYIRDATGTIVVPMDGTVPLKSGDRVTASGYAMPGEYVPTLEYARIKRLDSGSTPAPRELRDMRVLNNNFHGDLVRIRARLVDQWRSPESHILILQDLANYKTPFEAHLESAYPDESGISLRNGSELELTGISLIHTKGAQKYGFRLMLRSPQDIRILRSAPWWTTRHTYWALGALLLMILMALAWAAMLKRRVNRQTQIIKHRLEIEAALERRYRELFEESHDIVFSCDRSGKLESINPAGSKILGYSAAELLALDPLQLLAPDSLPRIREWLENKRLETGIPTLECELLAKDAHRISVEISGEILYAEGVPVGARGIARDVTERKNAEEALRQSEEKLRQAQKLEAIGNLAGGIAHDFNNILVAILGFAELSAADVPQGHPVASNLEQITKAAKRARNVVQQILAFSRKLEHARRPVRLQNVLEEALTLLKATLPATIEIRTHMDPHCGPVMADSTQMHQIILNLATNAAHAMKASGGQLFINLEPAWPDGSLARPLPELEPGRYLCLTVRDTGPGIDPQIQKQIFEPYFTTKAVGEGSGLGLAVVHGIVESYGGAIQLKSEPGKGACFQIYLPICQEAPAAPPAKAQAPIAGNGRILMVDDEEAIVALGRRSLGKLGYHVTGETSSVRALEIFTQDPQQFDLIVTDQTMPHLTGLSLAQEVWKIRPGIPIIISTGYSDQVTQEKSTALGFHTLLCKPYTVSELSQTIQRCLAMQGCETPAPAHRP